MTESPFVKAEGPEPPDEEVLLKEKHRETMAKLDAFIINQLKKQPLLHDPENTAKISVEDTRHGYTYYREQMQPVSAESEWVRAEVYRSEMELARSRNKLARATDELNLVSTRLSRAESRLVSSYQLIGQLVVYLDSIEWGTHDEWTRSQSLRERAHEYLTARTTIAT